MRIVVNDLQTREEVLQWYLELNSAGTPHSKEELDRVKALLARERDSGKARSAPVARPVKKRKGPER